MAYSRLDLSTRAIDLVNTVAKSSSTIGQIAKDVCKWITREGLNEEQFVYVCQPILQAHPGVSRV